MNRLLRSLSWVHFVLNHDFCPGANRWVMWIKHPLACLGAAAVVALCCAVLVNPAVFTVLAALGLIVGLGILWPGLSVRGLSVTAEFLQPRCRAGQQVTVRLRIRNRLPFPIWGLSLSRGFDDVGSTRRGVALARIPGWSVTELEWQFQPPRRGVYPLARPQLETGFPFGLWQARVPVAVTGELIVWPATVALETLPEAVALSTREDRLSDQRTGYCGDLLGTRPFRAGDSLRRVHWRQTARQGQLIVIERQAPATCAVGLIVDVRESSHQSALTVATLEQTLSIAASILESLQRQHAYVELVVDQQQVRVGAARSDLWRALDLLARIGSPNRQNIGHEGRVCSAHALPLLAVTTDHGLEDLGGLIPPTPRLRTIVVRTGSPGHCPVHPEGGCPAWIEVRADEALSAVFAGRWRRACHAA